LKSLSDYKGLAKCSIGTGSSVMLWTYSWSDVPLNLQFSHLYSFTVNETVSLHQAKSLEHLSDLFHLPLSNEAFAQFQVLQEVLLNISDSVDPDSWEVFGNNTSFKVSKAYKHFVGQHLVCPVIKKLWKTCCQSKHKVFFWLLLQDRLNTTQLLQRKSFFPARLITLVLCVVPCSWNQELIYSSHALLPTCVGSIFAQDGLFLWI
jgi:hypothetical protein